MVIGLDIDGTITRHPNFFAFISQALVQGGHQVVVITFREDRKSAADDLAVWGVAYSELITWSFQENPGRTFTPGRHGYAGRRKWRSFSMTIRWCSANSIPLWSA